MHSRLRVKSLETGLLIAGCALSILTSCPAALKSDKSFSDEPTAHALYSNMIAAMRQADTLSWVSDYRWEAGGKTLGHAIYKIWLKKPNYFRMEAMPAGKTGPSGILIGDGETSWVYWPNGKPRYGWEDKGTFAEDYHKYRNKFYMKKPAPLARHSISHEAGWLGAGMAMTILDPSMFHGYTDSLQPYLDGVHSQEPETIGNEACDVIEVSFMKHQRSWYLWLSRKDHLPRKLKQIVRVNQDIIASETWSDIAIDGETPNERFAWSAPADWKQWRVPDIEEGLLKAGTIAPDFELASATAGTLKLSSFRGKIVWLNKWRCG